MIKNSPESSKCGQKRENFCQKIPLRITPDGVLSDYDAAETI
ncbi:unknown [[Mannheimia] succiniciproducens MBEL55E]|uniref:Uncharacterized protein n=1 Tax=Mannheimia succiniciproducens (strain KCTC 0769BP / MBEL55E) TaxID=221988 RepID=Q65VY5_MANSM|nr:unknown [[Mannheimia] succiniciproducens MBEL55E]